jgi:hypothetical protein
VAEIGGRRGHCLSLLEKTQTESGISIGKFITVEEFVFGGEHRHCYGAVLVDGF